MPRTAAQKKVRRRYRTLLSVATTDLDRLNRRLMTILTRDIVHLQDKVMNGPLSDKEADTLISYTKMVKDLMKQGAKATEKLTDEELQKIASQAKRTERGIVAFMPSAIKKDPTEASEEPTEAIEPKPEGSEGEV